MRRYREREVTFEVKRSWQMPDLSRLAPGGGVVAGSPDELRAVYYDTRQRTLQRLGVTLRRRTGGSDAGWHLKVAAGPARIEYQSQAKSDRVPESLTRRLAGVLAGQELREVATITTTRCASRLLDDQGALLAEVADDRVFGAGIGEVATLERWREVEVELGPAGSEAMLAKITKAFRKADARPAPLQRKLDRLFARNATLPGPRTVNQAVAAYLQEQCREILLGDIALRDRPDPEAVHKTRVATRRLRSTLRNFGRALTLSPESRGELDDNLRWLATLLSPIRDGDILARRLTAEVAALPPEHVLGPVVREIEETLAAERSAAVQVWHQAWSDERYPVLMRTLADWLVAVPLAEEPVNGRTVLRKAQRKADRRLRTAGDDARQLHRARKTVKRLRYAAELLDDLAPKADRTAKAAKKQQAVLGDHQDLMVAADFLRRLGAQAGSRPGHNGFTYGLLMARIEHRAAEIRADL
ncbi:MAG TPA: CYTH and CHAD domain-containing protein [Propionibacteriaceae bacterium]|nr:CYTH and CHAD domain-containing protein [Propionibacteriaceae bacterium]